MSGEASPLTVGVLPLIIVTLIMLSFVIPLKKRQINPGIKDIGARCNLAKLHRDRITPKHIIGSFFSLSQKGIVSAT